MNKKIKRLVTGICCVSLLSGCKGAAAESERGTAPRTEQTKEQTGDQTKEPAEAGKSVEVESQSSDGNKKAILMVSFGTSYNDTREKTIDVIEEKVAAAYPDFEVRRAFTSQIIIDKLKARDGIGIDNVDEAMRKLVEEDFRTVVVQPTHIAPGLEFEEMLKQVEPYLEHFQRAVTGEALLTYSEDFEAVARILMEETAGYNQEGTGIVFLGHGTEHPANSVYADLEEIFKELGAENYFVGTVEAEPSVEDVISKVKAADSKRVVLLPLMIVAGDHAVNDMAGDGADSWKTRLQKSGFETECVLVGIGEYPGIQELMVSHVLDSLGFIREN